MAQSCLVVLLATRLRELSVGSVCRLSRVECARRLLESGADPSITRASGAGPFYLAAAVESSDGRSANPAMVKLLSEYAARSAPKLGSS